VAFYSRTFSPAEQNYDIHNRELLAIIQALEAWQHYIQGYGHTTVILSDHQNLAAHKGAKKPNRQHAQWFLFLSEYDIKLVHTPGKNMIQSDALSQWPDHCPEEHNDNEDMILLPENLFINLINIDLQRQIAEVDSMDKDAELALLLLLNGHIADDWTMEKFKDHDIFSIKIKIIFIRTRNYNKIFWRLSMITKLLDILGNCKLIMRYNSTIGGQDFEPLWKTMFKDAESVNSLK